MEGLLLSFQINYFHSIGIVNFDGEIPTIAPSFIDDTVEKIAALYGFKQ